jgi:hypothetical protein
MAKPRIWFDPPAFSWGRVLRIGALWSALVLVLLVPLLVTVDEERPGPAAPIEPAGRLALQPPAMLPVGPAATASLSSAGVAAPGASAPARAASAAR